MKTLPSTFVATIVLLGCTGRQVTLQEHMGFENRLVVRNYRSDSNPFFPLPISLLVWRQRLVLEDCRPGSGCGVQPQVSKVARAVPKRCSELRRSAFTFQMSSCPVCRNPAYVVPFVLQRQPGSHLPVAPTHILSM